jgi:penicillin-binding protein A
VRIARHVAVIGFVSLAASESRGINVVSRTADCVPHQQNHSSLDIARAKRDAGALVVKDPRGNRWALTLDAALQRAAQRKLASVRPEFGALVAIEVKTGKLRVLTEWPSPASCNESILFGRQFPAASVFKIVTTAALIEQAQVSLERKVCIDGGTHRIELEHLLAPREGIAQCSPFFEALGFSRNAVFAQLANQFLKPEDLENYADRFGFGSQLPLEVDIPLGQFQTEVDPLSFARAATGFTGSTLSPVGAAYLAYVIADGGRTLPLRLFDSDLADTPPAEKAFAAVRPETARALRQMMEVTVKRGTCWRAFHDDRGRPYLPHVTIAGKTGTLGEQDNTFSWFVAFAPSHRPEIVVSVLLKNGPLWHQKANEVGRDWLIEYFSHQRR